MSTNQIVKKGSRAFQVFSRLKSIKGEIGERFIETGALLCEVRDQGLYEDFGHASMYSFIADPELDLSIGYATMCMQVYSRFIVEFEIDPKQIIDTGWTKASIVVKVAEDAKEATKLLIAAAGQSVSDLKKTLLQLKGGIADEEKCSHLFIFEKCESCGQVRRKNESQS